MTEVNAKGERELEQQVVRAQEGDRRALELVIRAVQKDVHALALRFLWHPDDAEDATQGILVRVMTSLGGFRGNSGFRTWVYRVACNALLTLRKQRMEERNLTFEELGDDLSRGLAEDRLASEDGADEKLLLQEVRIGCTSAMLLCLDRNHRLAYILGEILELDHRQAAQVLEITPAAFRKRLSRARASITSFMASRCGLVSPQQACRCHRRVATAIELGRVDPSKPLFASSLSDAKRFPRLLEKIRQLEEVQRAAALYRSQPAPEPSAAFITWLRRIVDETPDANA